MLVEVRAKAVSPNDAKGDRATLNDDLAELTGILLSFTRTGMPMQEVGIGRARMLLADSSLVWHCRLSWIEEFTQKGLDEEDRARVGEGVDCTAYSFPDSVAQWRMRRGITVEPLEVARLAGRVGSERRRKTELATVPVRWERLGGRAHPDSLLYRMTYLRREGSRSDAHILVWGVTRQDGTTLATYYQGDRFPSTLEFAPGASPWEQVALRSVVALLRIPLRPTDTSWF